MAEAAAVSLRRRGWTTEITDSIRMLGKSKGEAGEAVFRGMLAVPGFYDAFHFGQLRTGGRLARFFDAASCRYLVPALDAHLRQHPVQLLMAVYATGAGAASRIKDRHPGMITAVFCTDVCPHWMWVHHNTDIYLVTFGSRCAIRAAVPARRADRGRAHAGAPSVLRRAHAGSTRATRWACRATRGACC